MSTINANPKVSYLPSSDLAITNAADALIRGELIAFPTETVYGLGADAENPDAVAHIYRAKGRPSNHPVIVHVAPEADLSHWVAALPWQAERLIAAFWPGPLTLILKRAAHINPAVSGGQDSIGMRCPSHPVAMKLLRAFAAMKPSGQGGVAAPSANKFGHVSPTRASHVRDEFPDLIDAGMPVLEGGASDVGIESTIIDLSRVDQGVGPVLLRPGFITAKEIEKVLGEKVGEPDAQAPRVSGALKSHYAPSTPLALAPIEVLKKIASQPKLSNGGRVAVVSYSMQPTDIVVNAHVDWIHCSNNPEVFAHDLYAQLRDLDKLGYEQIIYEQVPSNSDWFGIQDRLMRAAAGNEDTVD